jgi:hypothetical protein
MRALRSAPSGLVFFLLTLTYIEVGNPEVTPSVGKPACITKGLKNGATEMVRRLNFALAWRDLVGRFKEDHRNADSFRWH